MKNLVINENNLKRFKKEFPNVKVFAVSAKNGEGLEELITYLADELDKIEVNNIYDENEFESFIMYKFKDEKPYTITKDDDVWVIKGEEIEKLFKMTKFTEDESVLRFARKLRGMGVEDELEKAGAKRGDDVQILD